MYHVYLLKSLTQSARTYVGSTHDLRKRLAAHNPGRSIHTAKHNPWQLVTYLAFTHSDSAIAFERYLKSASGRAFANKRLR